MSKKNNFTKRRLFANNRDKRTKVSEDKAIEIPKKSFFQRWFRWDVITGVATILMLILTAIIYLPPKPVEKIRKKIRNNITVVESTFNPTAIKEENDSSKYLSLLAELQQSTIDYCILWKTLDDAEPYSKYSDYNPSEIANILSKEFNRINQLNEASSLVITAIKDIQTFEVLMDSSKVTSISHAKQNDILKFVELKNTLMTNAQKECIEFLMKANEESNNNTAYKKNLKKGLEMLDKVKDEVDYYKMDDAIIDYAIECNKLFKISKRYYIDK